jgi:hypothetical protein
MDYLPLNLRLMAHPLNWFIVFGIIFLAGLSFHAMTGKNLTEL